MRKVFLILSIVGLATQAMAQGFASFYVNDALVPAVIKFVTGENPSTVETIVPASVDIKNVNFKYKLLSNCSMETTISNDFSSPQTVVVNKNNGDSKPWLINIKQLKPASLPLELSFSKDEPSEWDSSVEGWAGVGVDETKPTVIRFGNKGVSFWVAFDEPATSVSYNLWVVSKEHLKFDGEFVVEASKDGKKWKTIQEFDDRKPISEDGNYTNKLRKDDRYVRWTYYTRNKQNINLNHIVVDKD